MRLTAVQAQVPLPTLEPAKSAARLPLPVVAELMALQQRRLLAMVAYAHERSAFLRHHWQAAGLRPSEITSTADFCAHAPLMDKDQMRDWRDRHDDPLHLRRTIERAIVSESERGEILAMLERLQRVARDGTDERRFAERRLAELVLEPRGRFGTSGRPIRRLAPPARRARHIKFCTSGSWRRP